MWGVQGILEVLTRGGMEEVLRFAYAASQFVPAGVVVGSAAVLAGLLGAAGVRKMRVAKPPTPPPAGVPWVLGMALLTSGIAAVPADATVLCRKGESARLVLRAAGCRAREHVADPRELGIDSGATCVDGIARAWRELDLLRAQLESARDLAERLALQPWLGGETWLELQAAEIGLTLTRLGEAADALGVTATAGSIAGVRDMVTGHWDHPAEACAAALALLPLLEAALPIPGAS